MLVRQALFQGTIRPGREAEFHAYVEERLLPLWKRYPGVREIRVLHEMDRDEGLPGVPLALTMTFEDADKLRAALESPIRLESREVTKGLFAMFDGAVHHYVFKD